MHTDEYEISISREIVVCKNMIENAKKAIKTLEKDYPWLLSNNFHDSSLDASHKAIWTKWKELQEGLDAWSKRLKEYEEAYRTIRSRTAWPNAI